MGLGVERARESERGERETTGYVHIERERDDRLRALRARERDTTSYEPFERERERYNRLRALRGSERERELITSPSS